MGQHRQNITYMFSRMIQDAIACSYLSPATGLQGFLAENLKELLTLRIERSGPDQPLVRFQYKELSSNAQDNVREEGSAKHKMEAER